MIPAALLGIKPWHRCLDLCASPGSKTTQLLEVRPKGSVCCSDAAGSGFLCMWGFGGAEQTAPMWYNSTLTVKM